MTGAGTWHGVWCDCAAIVNRVWRHRVTGQSLAKNLDAHLYLVSNKERLMAKLYYLMEQREHIYHYLPSNVHFGAVPSLCKREVFIVKLNLSLLSIFIFISSKEKERADTIDYNHSGSHKPQQTFKLLQGWAKTRVFH